MLRHNYLLFIEIFNFYLNAIVFKFWYPIASNFIEKACDFELKFDWIRFFKDFIDKTKLIIDKFGLWTKKDEPPYSSII